MIKVVKPGFFFFVLDFIRHYLSSNRRFTLKLSASRERKNKDSKFCQPLSQCPPPHGGRVGEDPGYEVEVLCVLKIKKLKKKFCLPMINNDYQSGVLRGCNYFQLLPSYGMNVRKVISGIK